jgi:hypothetical protein
LIFSWMIEVFVEAVEVDDEVARFCPMGAN